jgi:hypothetical protein
MRRARCLVPTRALSLAAAATTALTGCFDEPVFDAPAEADGVVFFDGFAEGVDFQAFAGTNQANPVADGLAIDTDEHHSGRASLRVVVPGIGDPAGAYAGGAFVAGAGRDLSGYDALRFFAKATRAVTFDVLGFGNDNTGSSTLAVQRDAVAIGADWTEITIPIPDPSRLTDERGLFFFAEGADGDPPSGYVAWFDDVQFVDLEDDELGAAAPAIDDAAVTIEVGEEANVGQPRVRFAARPADEVVTVMPAWFAFASSDDDVAAVDAAGVVRGLGPGSATITATLGDVPASGALALTVNPSVRPPTPPPTPSLPAGDVIALFADPYPTVPIDTWRAEWSACGALTDEDIAGDAVKRYGAVQYVGVEFTTSQIDASAMTALHLDVWTPDSTTLKVKLVDFGADGAYQGGDDSEHELVFTASSTPPLATGTWLSFDLPLSTFSGLRARAHLAQLILSGSTSTLYVDNVYLHR